MASATEIHACEDEDGADEEIDGDAFGQDEPGKEDGGDGIEIDVVGCYHSTQLLDDPVPCQITEHGGDTTQKQQIGQDIGTKDDTGRRQF